MSLWDMKITLESQESDLNQTNPETSGSLIFCIQALRGKGNCPVHRNMCLTLPALCYSTRSMRLF